MIAQEAARGLMVEVGKPGEFENTNADELRELIRTQLERAGLSVSAHREERGKRDVETRGDGHSCHKRVATPLKKPPAALGSRMRSGLFLAMMLAASSLVAAETPLTIGQLLAQGWEIAGYASGYDNRTSLILFRHPGVNALVQCGILYDVTRTQRTVVNCYELR